MAEGYEAYHVPQQSRRDKLRVLVQNHHQDCVDSLHGCANLAAIYDPSSLISTDLLTCDHHHHHQSCSSESHLGDPSKDGSDDPCVAGVKEEVAAAASFMGYSSSSAASHPLYMDPQPTLHLNHGAVQDVNHNPFLYSPQSIRFFDHLQPFRDGEVVVYRPEPLPVAAAATATHEASNNATNGQGLSLSLSSHSYRNTLPLELNLQRFGSSSMVNAKVGGGFVTPAGNIGGGDGSAFNELMSRSSVPLGPFTGYASILKGSRFLKPAQQLLEELCDMGRGIYSEKMAPADSAMMDPPQLESSSGSSLVDDPQNRSGGSEHTMKKSRLISMLDEVYRRYKQYYQQIQAVIASFESVSGLSNAAPFANLALRAMAKHFKCLKSTIMDQLKFVTRCDTDITSEKDGTPRIAYSGRGLFCQRPNNGGGLADHQPVWRPQRGLPERAVTVLRAWLFDHFLHPYPTDTDKMMLAKQTGLSRNQVSNWFINARVRLWKPMVEEIHMLETRQAQKALPREEENVNCPKDYSPVSTSAQCENPSNSVQRIQDLPTKKIRNDFMSIPTGTDDPIGPYSSLSRHPQMGGHIGSAGGSGVSLTLGLHQNNGMGLSDPFPVNAARRFGLDSTSEGFVIGGFEAQNRQFGRDVIGGQLLRDFVG